MSQKNKGPFAGWKSMWLVVGCSLAAAVDAEASGLSLTDAQDLALSQDPAVRVYESKRAAMQELAVASEQLPDPMLRLGLMSLPTDTWNLGQEPMTQAVVGISQKFPRGESRSLRSEQMLERSAAMDEMARDQRLLIALAVAEEYLEVLKQARLAAINSEAVQAFSDLADITEDYYATGRVQQQDVLRAAVELAKVRDRGTRIAQDEDRARARLEAWIGAAAWQDLAAEWPDPGAQPDLQRIREGLTRHPRILALQKEVEAADTGIALEKQRYRPEFGIDLAYGGRGGDNPDGSSRSDLFSVMMTMDLPLFHQNRQDRYTAAAVSLSSAAMFSRDDALRRMASEAAMQSATLERQRQRLELFEQSLLPDAAQNAEAAFAAYQAALESITTLMRARITEYDLQLDYANLKAELLKTRARLRYLEGEPS